MRLGSELAETTDFKEGRTITHAIRKLNRIAGFLLRFRGTWAVTGGTGVGTIHADAIYRAFVKRIAVNYNNADMQRVYGPTLRVLEKLFLPQAFQQTAPTTKAAGGSEEIELQTLVPFFMFHSNQPDAFALPADDAEVRSPTLTVECGSAEDAVYGDDGAYAINNGTLEVYELPMLGTPLDGSRYSPLLMYQIDQPISNTSNGLKIELSNVLAGMEIRAIIIESQSGGSGGADFIHDNAVMTYAALNVNGVDVFKRTAASVIRNRNKMFYGLTATETGVAVLDSAEDRETAPGELWSVRGQVKPYLEVDVVKGAGENRLLITVIATNGRIS